MDHVFSFRIDYNELLRLQESAYKQGKTVSAYIRDYLFSLSRNPVVEFQGGTVVPIQGDIEGSIGSYNAQSWVLNNRG